MRRRRIPRNVAASVTDASPTDQERTKQTDTFSTTSNSGEYNCYETEISFVVARELMLRTVAMVFFFSFYGAFLQNSGLMGSYGLVPAHSYMNVLQNASPSKWNGFLNHPTLFWWIAPSDRNQQAIAIAGVVLSIMGIIIGDYGWSALVSYRFRWAIFFSLWLLHFSIVTIAGGTSFYSYGWESQLLETGFLCIFLCRIPWIDKCPRESSSANKIQMLPILWLFRWLSFRISMGAGLIKLRGSSCWIKKTCLHYHFETQPLPSPLSFIFHFLPKSILSRAVDLDLFVQVYTSWFVMVPDLNIGRHCVGRSVRRLGGFIQAGFMVNIMLSGNFSLLNHITIVPALACLDDECFGILSRWVALPATPFVSDKRRNSWLVSPRFMLNFFLIALIGYLSIPTVSNLSGSDGRQVMNGSFDRFRLVNTYGAFGSVGEARYEPIISVSTGDRSEWVEIEFPCKPGSITRRPCFCAPYHYRLDWNIWFIGFKPHQAYLRQRETWLYRLLEKLLDVSESERPWLGLLDKSSAAYLENTYNHTNTRQLPIRVAKVDMYHYQMANSLWNIVANTLTNRTTQVVWWKRSWKESLIPPVELDPKTKRLRLVATSHGSS